MSRGEYAVMIDRECWAMHDAFAAWAALLAARFAFTRQTMLRIDARHVLVVHQFRAWAVEGDR